MIQTHALNCVNLYVSDLEAEIFDGVHCLSEPSGKCPPCSGVNELATPLKNLQPYGRECLP
jgi:hypothetical protein